MLWNAIVQKEPIHKGWSCDKKFCAQTADGTKYLLRLTPHENSGTRRQLFDLLGALWTAHLQPLWNELTACLGAVTTLLLTLWNTVLAPFVQWLITALAPVAVQVFAALGTAVSEISEEVLRSIEREARSVERSRPHAELQNGERLSDSRPENPGRAGDAGQVRQDAQGVSEGVQKDDVQQPAADGRTDGASDGNRPDGGRAGEPHGQRDGGGAGRPANPIRHGSGRAGQRRRIRRRDQCRRRGRCCSRI